MGLQKISQQDLGTGWARNEQELIRSESPCKRAGWAERAGARTSFCPRDGQDARGDPTADAASCLGGWEEVDDSRRGRRKVRRGAGRRLEEEEEKQERLRTYPYMITISMDLVGKKQALLRC